jgi:CheY-like chemotaxis protein
MSEPAEHDFAPLSVLIVDDEAPARDRLRDLLGDIADTQPTRIAGMAASGVEALALLEREPVDLVLTDIRMPVMDGIELARHLGRLPHPPAVIFTTAYDEYAVRAFELAAVDYLLKPVRAGGWPRPSPRPGACARRPTRSCARWRRPPAATSASASAAASCWCRWPRCST